MAACVLSLTGLSFGSRHMSLNHIHTLSRRNDRKVDVPLFVRTPQMPKIGGPNRIALWIKVGVYDL